MLLQTAREASEPQSDEEAELLDEYWGPRPVQVDAPRVVPRVALLIGGAILLVVLQVGALLCLAGRGEAEAAAPTGAQSAPDQMVDLQAEHCQDTLGWTNGFSDCETDGYASLGCVTGGLNCLAYAANGWCVDGRPEGEEGLFGDRTKFPERHCCACGGGSQLTSPTPAPPVATTLPAPSACSAYAGCKDVARGSDCCPTSGGVFMSCCTSQLVCADTAHWTNGWVQCRVNGVTAEQGCTPGGLSCDAYMALGLCSNGTVVKGKEWTLGGGFNHPELNCCVCGKDPSGSVANGVWT